MQSTCAPIPTSEKIFICLSAARDHLGLIITFALTLMIPVATIAIGLAGNDVLITPIVGGILLFIIPYFILVALKSSISHGYEVALVTQFGLEKTATVIHKSMEHTSHYADNARHDDEGEKIDIATYFIEYKYTYDKPYKSTFCIGNKALYDIIEIGSEVPIKLLVASPDKSAPERGALADIYGLKVSDCL